MAAAALISERDREDNRAAGCEPAAPPIVGYRDGRDRAPSYDIELDEQLEREREREQLATTRRNRQLPVGSQLLAVGRRDLVANESLKAS